MIILDENTSQAVVVIILSTILGYILATFLYLPAFPSSTKVFGFFYEQLVGIFLGFIVGVLVAGFSLKPDFLSKVRGETFSFIALSVSLFIFLVNLINPRIIAQKLGTLTVSNVGSIPPSYDNIIMFSLFISIIMAAIITFIVFNLLDKNMR